MIKLKTILESTETNADSEEMRDIIGMDDNEFLKIWWKESIENVQLMLERLQKSLHKNDLQLQYLPKKYYMINLVKKERMFIKDKIKLLTQVLQHKQADPNFIPDYYK